MPDSYRKIDYGLRPAKHAERLMMCDAFRRLRFGTIESYQYIGLGSVYFKDFALFHRALGISRMISIEATDDQETQKRFLENRPYSNIEMSWGWTKTQLPQLDLSLRSIIWLDYDGRLSREVLDDVRSVVSRVGSGTSFNISVQCQPIPLDASDELKNVRLLEQELGRDKVPPSLTDHDLLGWGVARVYRDAIMSEVQTILSQRNGVRPEQQRLAFDQIMHFHYKDGAYMLTLGGIISDHGQRPLFEQCAFHEMDFYRNGAEAFRIDLPKLTARELRALEAQLPLPAGASLVLGSAPERDANWYKTIYKYFPNFAPVDL